MFTMKKLKTKKGFAFIELIVVIAIIGLLLAIVIPNVNTMNNRVTTQNNKARDFYYSAQSVMTEVRLARDANIKLNGDTLIRMEGATGITTILNGTPQIGFTDYLRVKLQPLLNISDESEEWFYLAVDGNYRVVAAYVSGLIIPDVTEPFSPANRISGLVVGSYPVAVGETNENIRFA